MKLQTLKQWQKVDEIRIVEMLPPSAWQRSMSLDEYLDFRSSCTCDYSAMVARKMKGSSHESNPAVVPAVVARSKNSLARLWQTCVRRLRNNYHPADNAANRDLGNDSAAAERRADQCGANHDLQAANVGTVGCAGGVHRAWGGGRGGILEITNLAPGAGNHR
jgi:hypothetical protein